MTHNLPVFEDLSRELMLLGMMGGALAQEKMYGKMNSPGGLYANFEVLAHILHERDLCDPDTLSKAQDILADAGDITYPKIHPHPKAGVVYAMNIQEHRTPFNQHLGEPSPPQEPTPSRLATAIYEHYKQEIDPLLAAWKQTQTDLFGE